MEEYLSSIPEPLLSTTAKICLYSIIILFDYSSVLPGCVTVVLWFTNDRKLLEPALNWIVECNYPWLVCAAMPLYPPNPNKYITMHSYK